MAATFEIVTVEPRTVAMPGGTFTEVQRVTFKTRPDGLVGVVNIPAVAFSAAEVEKVVGPLAAELIAVKAL